MSATIVNLTICQDAAFVFTFQYRDKKTGQIIQLPDYTIGRFDVKAQIDDTVFLFQATEAFGKITFGPTLGEVTLNLPASDTKLFTWTDGIYDLEIEKTTDPDDVIRLVQGHIVVDPSVG